MEVPSIEAAVTGNEPVSVRLGVRADKEVRYNAVPGATPAPVVLEHAARGQSGLRRQAAELDTEALQRGLALTAPT